MFSGDMFISCHATRNEPKKRARGGDCAKRPLLTPPCAPQAHAPSFAYTIGVCRLAGGGLPLRAHVVCGCKHTCRPPKIFG